MPLLSRVLIPDFDPGSTVENAGVAPKSAREDDVRGLDERLVALLRSEPVGGVKAADEQQLAPEVEPAAADSDS